MIMALMPARDRRVACRRTAVPGNGRPPFQNVQSVHQRCNLVLIMHFWAQLSLRVLHLLHQSRNTLIHPKIVLEHIFRPAWDLSHVFVVRDLTLVVLGLL